MSYNGLIALLIISAAFEYLKTHPVDPIDYSEFNDACGVGVVVTREEILQVVMETLKNFEQELKEKRYKFNVGRIMGVSLSLSLF